MLILTWKAKRIPFLQVPDFLHPDMSFLCLDIIFNPVFFQKNPFPPIDFFQFRDIMYCIPQVVAEVVAVMIAEVVAQKNEGRAFGKWVRRNWPV